jgi:hypothetical protein
VAQLVEQLTKHADFKGSLALSEKGKESFIEECLVPVAQLAEQLTNDLEFKGSNPAAAVT